MIVNIKEIIDKLASRKPGVTAVAGATAATGAVEVTWPGYSDGVYRGGRRWWIRGASEAW